MYGIKRSDGEFFCKNPYLRLPSWDQIDGTKVIYVNDSLEEATRIKERIYSMYSYTSYFLIVHKFTEEELKTIVFNRLRGH